MGLLNIRILNFWQNLMLRNGSTESRPGDNARSVKWIDGLRGLASFSVIVTHLAHAFDYDLYKPSDTPEAPMRFFQYPFIRLWTQGRIGVAIFALMTGFVCGIKPLKQIRADDPQAAFKTIARAIFKRPMRLMIPGIIATLVAFVVCQLGLFYVAGRVDATWIRLATAQPRPTFAEELWRLQHNLRGVWTDGQNDYDDHQWTLLPLLKCSLYVYLTLCALVFVRFKYRLVVYVLLFSYFWQDNSPNTETFMCNAYFGLFLSDLSQNHSFQGLVQQKSTLRRVVSVFLIICGLFIGSYPMEMANYKQWSTWIEHLKWGFPDGTSLPKRFTALGLISMTLGIVLNNSARVFLSSAPLLFLGKHSFAVYLTHGTLLKTVLIWMIYGTSGEPYDESTTDAFGSPAIRRCGLTGFFFWVPVWITVVYAFAWIWTTYVDTWSEKVSQWVMEKCYEGTEKTPLSASMA